MGRRDKKKKKEKEQRPKKDFKAFLKKRAPIYLGLIALFVVFIVPELTKGSLESSLPELSAEDKKIADILMEYNGPNQSGLTVVEAISNKIGQMYPNEKIFNNKKTSVTLTITAIDSQVYKVVFNFKSHKEGLSYDWNVDAGSGEIISNNPESKYIIDLVDYYD